MFSIEDYLRNTINAYLSEWVQNVTEENLQVLHFIVTKNSYKVKQLHIYIDWITIWKRSPAEFGK